MTRKPLIVGFGSLVASAGGLSRSPKVHFAALEILQPPR